MEFSILGALVAGLVATLVMAMVTRVAGSMGMTDMPPMPLVLGSIFTSDRDSAKATGAFLHFGMMGAVVFGPSYAALFVLFDSTVWWLGILIGLIHAALVGAFGLPMVGSIHPRMVPATDGPVTSIVNGEVEIERPGVFGINWGGMTPMGLLVAHAVFGLVMAIIYGLFT